MVIGILALQGNVREHLANLNRHDMQGRPVRLPGDLAGIEGLILPGGESTAIMRNLVSSSGLEEPVGDLIHQGLPVWGTCAVVVLLARGGIWPSVDIQVERNAYGSQTFSRLVHGTSALSETPTPMVFIRSPRIVSAGREVEVLAEVEGDMVAARQGGILLTTFHPELVDHSPFTACFIDMVKAEKGRRLRVADPPPPDPLSSSSP